MADFHKIGDDYINIENIDRIETLERRGGGKVIHFESGSKKRVTNHRELNDLNSLLKSQEIRRKARRGSGA